MSEIVNEVKKLSRVWQHVNSNRPFCLITAFRGEFTYEENVNRNRSLAADVRNAGYGFFHVDGYWIENQGTDNEKHVAEDTLFVIGDEDLEKELRFSSVMITLGKRYNQEAILLKTSKGIRIQRNMGADIPLSKIHLGKMGEIYTKLRSNKQANTFVFESERVDLGWLQRLAGITSSKNSK